MVSVPTKPIFIPGNDEDYVSSVTKPATVFTVLPYKRNAINCSPTQCHALKEIPGLLLIWKTLEERQEYYYNSPRRVAIPVTAFLENGISVEADTYALPVASVEEESWDDWELHACISSERPYPISCPAPGELIQNMPGIADENSTDDSVSADLPIEDQKV